MNITYQQKYFAGSVVAAFLVSVLLISFAHAASTVVVTPSNTQGWSTSDTRPGGQVNYVSDSTSPYPSGALQLTTDMTTTAKAQYMMAASTSLAYLNQLSYATKQVAGPAYADPSYQLAVDLNGAAAGGFTTLIYEPYQNGTPVQGVWQQWDVATGQLWSSRSFSEGSCSVVAGGGGAPFYTLSGLKAACPNAVVLGFGVNVGSNNPGYNVYADGVNFNGTLYNFEVTPPAVHPMNKEQCKKDGWKKFSSPSFKNQGQCVSSFKKSK